MTHSEDGRTLEHSRPCERSAAIFDRKAGNLHVEDCFSASGGSQRRTVRTDGHSSPHVLASAARQSSIEKSATCMSKIASCLAITRGGPDYCFQQTFVKKTPQYQLRGQKYFSFALLKEKQQ
jgi:hypothetical protein